MTQYIAVNERKREIEKKILFSLFSMLCSHPLNSGHAYAYITYRYIDIWYGIYERMSNVACVCTGAVVYVGNRPNTRDNHVRAHTLLFAHPFLSLSLSLVLMIIKSFIRCYAIQSRLFASPSQLNVHK